MQALTKAWRGAWGSDWGRVLGGRERADGPARAVTASPPQHHESAFLHPFREKEEKN